MRIKNAFRNSFFSVISQIILIIVGFFCQRVMNLRLGEELVGMNGVISNIIALLSVTELGVSTAVIFHLYGALAKQDEKLIASLMNLYRKAYTIFFVIITVLGLCVLPFVHLVMKENSFFFFFIRLIYILWLLRTSLSYLLSYKRSILIADQKEYIVSIGLLIANVLNYSLIIVIVELWQNYALALGLNIVVEIIMNFILTRYVDKKYRYLRELRKEPLQENLFKKVFGDIKNIFVTRISAKVLLSTDSLIISGFISVGLVGLYSNYCMITQSLTNVLVSLSNALQPTVGNMFTEGDHEKEYGVLRQITFIFFWIASFCATSLLTLMTPFVSDIWLGNAYVLQTEIVAWCVINFYTNIITMPLNMMMGVTGLFKKERNISVVAAVINLVLSLILVQFLGVVGVLLGTFAAYIVQFIFRMRVLIMQYMKMQCKKYVCELLSYIIVSVIEVIAVYWVSQYIYTTANLINFCVLMILCVIVPNGLNLLLFCKTWRFQSVFGMVRDIKRQK